MIAFKIHFECIFCFRWDDVEDSTTTVDTNNETEVRLFSINLYRVSLAYLDEIRSIELNQLGKLRYVLQNVNIRIFCTKIFLDWKLMRKMPHPNGTYTFL